MREGARNGPDTEGHEKGPWGEHGPGWVKRDRLGQMGEMNGYKLVKGFLCRILRT